MEMLTSLLARRSTSVRDLTEPAPNAAELEKILTAATRVPDHGKLCPWRIVVLSAQGKSKLGAFAAQLFAADYPTEATEVQLAHEQARFQRAPMVLAVLSTLKESIKAPAWEQELSAGAVCMNILHACHALGYGAKWLTEWVAYRTEILEMLGGSAADKVAGFIYIGTKTLETEDRERPKLEAVVQHF